ncbi:MAG: STAS/SEC14 domain-containing protein [Flavobacteriales bacterium]|nr:STAS/SEC14 domain-containing protein [Flavobacteriales bacterium]
MYARFDLSAFPVVTIAFTGESSTDENFQQYLNETEALYEHKKRFSIIFDARSASLPDLKHQKMQANWIKANESRMKTYCAGTAYVIVNKAVRAILKMIFTFYPQPQPYKIFSDMASAEVWAREVLEKK